MNHDLFVKSISLINVLISFLNFIKVWLVYNALISAVLQSDCYTYISFLIFFSIMTYLSI